MTIKEQIVEIIRGEGFDFITACSMADECIREFKESGKQAQRYYIGKKAFTIAKRGGSE